jgi:O-antigen ligase
MSQLEDSRTVRSIAHLLLLALGFVLPFEAPLFSLGPLVITLPELFLYLLCAIWGTAIWYRAIFFPGTLARARTTLGEIAGAPLPRAVALWGAVTILSAVAASNHRLPALKFALRTSSGVLLYFAARDLTQSSSMARRLVMAIVAGAVLSASSTFLEALRPEWSSWWHPFRDTQFSVSGVLRASGTFAFPNIAAMYWEASLPLLLLVPSWENGERSRPERLRFTFRCLLAAILIHAVLASATRASIYGVAFVAALLLVLARLGRRSRRRTPYPAVSRFAFAVLLTEALLAAAAVWQSGATSVTAQRLLWWREGDWYRARYTVEATEPSRMSAGTTQDVRIQVQNVGRATWHSDRAPRVELGYRWDSEGSPPSYDHALEGRRTPLSQDVAPQEVTTIAVRLAVPTRPGTYLLRWDLLVDDGERFSNLGTSPAVQQVVVEPSIETIAGSRPELVEGAGHVPLPSRSQLWVAALRLWRQHPVLGVGPDNFRRRYGEVISPGGGGRYSDERLHANNLYLEVLADMGLAGAAALLVLIHALLTQARRSMRAPDLADPMVVFALLAILAFFVHGLVDYFFEFTPTLDLWWLLLALASQDPLGPSP